MKPLKISAAALPMLLAAAASAAILPIAPINGSPLRFPSPIIVPHADLPLILPAPERTPDVVILPAPAFVDAVPAYAPSELPVLRIDASRENVIHPLISVVPDVTLRLAGGIFDGSKAVDDDVEDPRRAPVVPSRHISLPEQDLEAEIGAL